MPERSALTQATQIGVEATPGTLVPANRVLKSIGIDLGFEGGFQRYRPFGHKFASMVVLGQEWSTFDLSGTANYSELPYILSSVMAAATPTQIAATTAYRWIHTPSNTAEDTVKTLSIEQGGSVRAHRAAYGLIAGLEMNFTRAGVELSGAGIARNLEDGITMTASPTSVPERPVLPKNVDVFVDAAGGTIGTTKLLRALRATWRFQNRFNPVWALNSAQSSYVAHVEVEPTAQLEILVAADSVGMGLLTNARAGDTRLLRVKATDAVDAGVGNPYSLSLDMGGKVSGVSRFSDEDGVYAIAYTFDATPDAGLGYAMRAEVVNALTGL